MKRKGNTERSETEKMGGGVRGGEKTKRGKQCHRRVGSIMQQ